MDILILNYCRYTKYTLYTLYRPRILTKELIYGLRFGVTSVSQNVVLPLCKVLRVWVFTPDNEIQYSHHLFLGMFSHVLLPWGRLHLGPYSQSPIRQDKQHSEVA